MTNGFIWDDPQYVVENPTLKSPEGLWQIWTDPTATPQYYPLVHTTFWIEARLWGTEHAPGFHVDNILLHALATVLLWRALAKLEIPAAFLAAAIFAVHPVMVESVAWVTERKNVLSIVFYLLAFHAYWRTGLMSTPKPVSEVLRRAGSTGKVSGSSEYLRDRLGDAKQPFNRLWYFASLIFFLFALLSKTVTCSLPAAVLLILWWKRGRIGWQNVKPLLPMLVMGLALSSVTSHLEHTNVGARGPDFNWTLIDRCLIAGHAVCFYALKLLWPHPLIFMYPKWDLHVDRAIQFGYPLIVIWLLAMLWFTRRWIGRGPLTAVLFFIGTLFPALGFVDVYPMRYSFVADHFQYLASLGVIVLVAVGLHRISRYALLIVLPLAWITWHQQSIYADAKTLWTNTIAQNPDCWMAHVNLAGVYRTNKQFDAAMIESKRALDLAPNEADTHYDYGRDLALRSDWPGAIAQFKLATDCDPEHAQIWSDLSQLLWDHSETPQGQAEALTDARKALAIQPNMAAAHYVLARYAELRGDLPGAIDEYQKGLLINNEDYQSHYNLGTCLLEIGRSGEAAGEFQKVLRHDPRNALAWTNLGYACLSVGKTNQAAQYFQQALSIRPDLTAAIAGLKQSQSR